ncbi:DMT family transporter [Polynucleobacter sp. UK-FUSCHL-C3]|uniref:DMT family transporter n=1 Tax=Polynucleobacter sp. UK-FUSCHL-C3 TaxID=2955208 RepID=A0AAU8A449_9BURK
MHVSALTAFYLTTAALMWAGNAIVGKILVQSSSPVLLNSIRWGVTALILLPFAWRVFGSASPLWQSSKRFALLSLLGVGSYNVLLYLALESSTPINVTLIGASMPIWAIVIGALFYKEQPNIKQIIGAVISLIGVIVVIVRGELERLIEIEFVAGDLLMVLATILWGAYSWMLSHPKESTERTWPWSYFLLAQVGFGFCWSLGFAVTEWQLEYSYFTWSWPTVFMIIYVIIGPSLIAYRCWGLGVSGAGATVATFFTNLIPLFTAILSTLLLQKPPELFQGVAFALILAGIYLSIQKKKRI